MSINTYLSMAASLALVAVTAACATPEIRPEPFALTGSWSLKNAVSELPVSSSFGRSGPVFESESTSSVMDLEALRQAMQFVTEPPRRLGITQTASAVMLSLGGGRPLVVYTDGRPSDNFLECSRECECLATWKGGVLFVEHRLEGRTHVVETYTRSGDGTRLIVTVMLQDSRLSRPLTSLRAYEQSSSS